LGKSVYYQLAETIERNPFGIPRVKGEISEAFIDFLSLIYTPAEAELGRHLNVYPMFKTAAQIADHANRDLDEVKAILDGIHAKYAAMGLPQNDQHALPTMFYIFNFHNRYPEIRENDLDAAALYQKFFIEEGFYHRYENSDEGTPVFRTIPIDRSIEVEQKVMTSEEAHERINSLDTDFVALVPCPCRTRTEKMGIRECHDKFPIGACIIPGDNGRKFVELGLGKGVTKEQAIKYMDEMQEAGLVINSDNSLAPDPIVICLCCGCCCSQMKGRTRWGNLKAILPASFIPVAGDDCIKCKKCAKRCLVDALAIDEAAGKMVVDPEKCIGCGICTLRCSKDTLKLHRYERKKPFDHILELGMALYKENKETMPS